MIVRNKKKYKREEVREKDNKMKKGWKRKKIKERRSRGKTGIDTVEIEIFKK